MASFFPECLPKYGVTLSPADLGDLTGTVVRLFDLVWKMDEDMKKAQAATIASGGTKVVPLFDQSAKRDKVAAKIAADLIARTLDNFTRAIEKNAHVAWHLAEIDKTVAAFNTSEVNYYRYTTDKAAGVKAETVVDSLATLRADRKEVIQFLQRVIATAPTVLDELPDDKKKVTKSGETVLKLPNIQGRGVGETGTPTGKFGRLSHMIWTVGEETFPAGTESRDLIRVIWKGAERVGKRPGDLYDALGKAEQETHKRMMKNGESVSFTLGGRAVVVLRPSDYVEPTEDDEPDDETDEDSEE